jgi:hypothetical protein
MAKKSDGSLRRLPDPGGPHAEARRTRRTPDGHHCANAKRKGGGIASAARGEIAADAYPPKPMEIVAKGP